MIVPFQVARARAFAALAKLGVSVRTDKQSRLELQNSNFFDADAENLRFLDPRAVRHLWLCNTSISDFTVANISHFARLVSLNLARTNVSDCCIRYLGAMEQLAELCLGYTQVSDRGCALLPELLPRLDTLDLVGNNITDASCEAIARLPNLDTLAIGNTKITDKGLLRLSEKPRYVSLDLGQLSVSSAGLLSLLPSDSLNKLWLDYLEISADVTSALAACGSLDFLSLNHASIPRKGLMTLWQSPSLSQLSCDSISGFAPEVFDSIVELRTLAELSLNCVPLGLASLRAIAASTVKTLMLEDSELDDEGCRILAGSTLHDLSIRRVKATDVGIGYLSNARELSRLMLSGSAIGDCSVRALSRLATLEDLTLHGTSVTDEGVAALADLTSLTSIDLSATPITDNSCEFLGAMELLSNIKLAETAITDDGVGRLVRAARGRTRYLMRLDLSGTKISDRCIADLCNGPELTFLHVSRTNLTIEGLSRLYRMMPRTYIHAADANRSDDDLKRLLISCPAIGCRE